jgi:hypothetical protein
MKKLAAKMIGLVSASIFPAAYLAIFYPLSGIRDASSIVGTFFIAYFFSALVALVVGLPALWALDRLRLVNLWSAMICGALTGITAITAIRYGGSLDSNTAWRFVILGAISGSLFWAVYRVCSSELSKRHP